MDDLISRQAAIDELKRISFSHWFECGEYLSEDTREIEIINSKKALEVIEALPSEQPEIIHCGDCKYYGRADKRRFYRGMDCLQKRIATIVPDKDFCSRAERRTDEGD